MRKVLFIAADQWRGDFATLHAGPGLTPHLDSLAAEGVRFSRYYTPAVPCGPARATLLTGLYPFVHRSVRNATPLDARFSNVALEARAAGLDPVLFGYTDSSVDPRTVAPDDPRTRSFEGILPGLRLEAAHNELSLQPWATDLVRKGYAVPERLHDLYNHPGSNRKMATFSRAPALYRAPDSDTAWLTDRLLDWWLLRRDDPWFVHLVWMRPHPPFIAPEPYNTLVDPAAVAAPSRRPSLDDERATHPFLAAWLGEQDSHDYLKSQVNPLRVSLEDLMAMRAVYLGLIAEVDAHLGRLVAHLKVTGEWDETLVIVTADHGEMLGDHWCWGKGGYFEPSNHVPLVIRVPGMPPDAAGRVVDAFTESVDIAPTILDWLGLEAPADMNGASLMPWLRGESPAAWRDYAFWEFDFRSLGDGMEEQLGLQPDQCTLDVIREDRWKFVHFTTLPPLLFDLENDPGEFENRAGDPACQGEVARLARRLLSHRMLHAERSLANTKLGRRGARRWTGPRGAVPRFA